MTPRPDPAASSALLVGSVLEGKYELTRLIGGGGMGEVYEGRHRVIGRRVAVKLLRSDYAKRPEVAARFANEARAAGGIEHEHVGGVYDVGALSDGTQYLVMEFLDGQDLEKLVATGGALPIGRALLLVIQACRGLEVVHARGIVHRDLKPANLFVTQRADKTDLVKVIDFGIAKLGEGGTGATKTGVAMGTAHYMSPEQARGEREIGPATDIYAIGVILYELLSGQKPFDGDSFLQIVHRVLLQQHVPLRALRPGLPDGLYDAVTKAMAPVASDRFGSVAELAAALSPFAGATTAAAPSIAQAATVNPETSVPVETGIQPSPQSAAVRRRRKPSVIAVAVGGVLIVAAGAVGLSRHASEGPPSPTTPSTAVRAPPVVTPEASVVLPEPIVATGATSAPRVSAVSGHRTPSPPAKSSLPAAGSPILAATADAGARAPPAPNLHSPAKPSPSCDPNFTYDANGNKQFKPECFLNP